MTLSSNCHYLSTRLPVPSPVPEKGLIVRQNKSCRGIMLANTSHYCRLENNRAPFPGKRRHPPVTAGPFSTRTSPRGELP